MKISERRSQFNNAHLFAKVCAYKRSKEPFGLHCTLCQPPWNDPWNTEVISLPHISTATAMKVGIPPHTDCINDNWGLVRSS